MRELHETKKHEADEVKRATKNKILGAHSNEKFDKSRVKAMNRVLAKAKK